MSPEPTIPREQPIGVPLPDFTLRSVRDENDAWRLHDRAAGGRGAVIVFWSSVCSHCMRYDPYFNAFSARHPEFTFAAVASRQGETGEQIRTALAARGLTFPVIHDPDSAVAKLLFTQQTPRVFLVDAESRLRYRGAVDNFKYAADSDFEAYLEPAIEAFLAGQPIARADTASFGCAIQSVYYTIAKPLKLR